MVIKCVFLASELSLPVPPNLPKRTCPCSLPPLFSPRLKLGFPMPMLLVCPASNVTLSLTYWEKRAKPASVSTPSDYVCSPICFTSALANAKSLFWPSPLQATYPTIPTCLSAFSLSFHNNLSCHSAKIIPLKEICFCLKNKQNHKFLFLFKVHSVFLFLGRYYDSLSWDQGRALCLF